ncbi:MAG TPA: flagellar biosynthesis anti-sigma factor FlgM [Polyangia bacterium]
MAFTGRPTSGKLTPGAAPVPGSGNMDGEQIARAVRVEELRRLVAAGRYQVEPHKLAARILQRALAPRR